MARPTVAWVRIVFTPNGPARYGLESEARGVFLYHETYAAALREITELWPGVLSGEDPDEFLVPVPED